MVVVRAVVGGTAFRAWATKAAEVRKEGKESPVVLGVTVVLVVVADLGTIVGSSSDEGGKEGVVGVSIGVVVVVAELSTFVRASLDGSVFFWNSHCDGLVATVPFGVEGSV